MHLVNDRISYCLHRSNLKYRTERQKRSSNSTSPSPSPSLENGHHSERVRNGKHSGLSQLEGEKSSDVCSLLYFASVPSACTIHSISLTQSGFSCSVSHCPITDLTVRSHPQFFFSFSFLVRCLFLYLVFASLAPFCDYLPSQVDFVLVR